MWAYSLEDTGDKVKFSTIDFVASVYGACSVPVMYLTNLRCMSRPSVTFDWIGRTSSDNVCVQYGRQWDILFNPSKSQLITFGSSCPTTFRITFGQC